MNNNGMTFLHLCTSTKTLMIYSTPFGHCNIYHSGATETCSKYVYEFMSLRICSKSMIFFGLLYSLFDVGKREDIVILVLV